MPVISEIETREGKILRWHVNETVDSLENQCVQIGLGLPPAVHIESRRKQVMVTALLHYRLFPGTRLSYTRTGKPMVDNGQHVSISHSGDVLVMMKSNEPCGIDIERIHPRVRKVRHKFLNDSELLTTTHSSDFTLTQFWTAKEAMFKVYGSDKVFMRSNIFVHDLSETESTAVLKDGQLEIKRKIKYRITGDMMLAWTEKCDEA